MSLNVRRDEHYLRNCRLGFAAIVLCMPFVLAAWAFLQAARFEVKLIPMLLWMTFSAVLGHYVFLRPLTSYRCPQCGRALPRAEEARPWIRFRCEPCGVEWDVERSDGSGGGE
jgi:hypothetical protein